MEGIKLNVHALNEDGELIIRVGPAPAPLPTHEPDPLQFIGQIDAVSEFISKKHSTINVIESHIIVDDSVGIIRLTLSENEHFKRVITGVISESEDMSVFPINTGKKFTTFELANLIRMNRYYFRDRASAMTLVTQLKSFKAKVSKALEKSDNDQGNRRILLDQIVEHNIPPDFQLTMPIYQGCGPLSFMVEVIVDADSLEVSLESPELREHLKEIKQAAIEEELTKIRALLPELAILFQ